MGQVKFANFGRATLVAPITAAQTSFSVSNTTNFPALGTNEWFYLTLTSVSTPTQKEIVKVTAYSGNVLTSVLRGQDDTSAFDFATNDIVEGTATKGLLEDLNLRDFFASDTSIADHADSTVLGSIAHCLGAIDTDEKVLCLGPGTFNILNNLTIPSNVTLKPSVGTKINILTGMTLTLSKIDAGPQHQGLFEGAGDVAGTLVVDEAYSEWFGGGVGVNSGAAANKVLALTNTVKFLDGEYLIEESIVLNTGQSVIGSGMTNTFLKLADGADTDIIISRDFATLTGTNAWFVDTDNVPHGMQIQSINIDGNKANNASGYGIRLFAKRFLIYGVMVKECATGGMYTEAGAVTGQNDWRDQPEAWLDYVWLSRNNGNGWTMNGPHDTAVGFMIINNSGGWGLHMTRNATVDGSGLVIQSIHTYSNGLSVAATGGIRLEGGQAQIAYCSNETEQPGLHMINADNTYIGRYFGFSNTNRITTIAGTGLTIETSEDVNIGDVRMTAVNTLSFGSPLIHIDRSLRTVFGSVTLQGNNTTGTAIHIDAVDISNRSNGFQLNGGNIYNFTGVGGTGIRMGNHTNNMGVVQCKIDCSIADCESCFDYENNNANANHIDLRCFTNAGQNVLHASSEPPSTVGLGGDRWQVYGFGNDAVSTERSGSATVLNGTTFIDVTHNLAIQPIQGDIMVTPVQSLGAASEFFINNLNATTFRINLDVDPGADVLFAWRGWKNGVR